jgi:tetratricopeptide (TPR) repeat protein
MTRRWVWALGVLGVVMASIISLILILEFIANRDAHQEAQARVERGVDLYLKAAYPEAQADFRRVIQLNPGEWKAPFYMGIIKIHLKKYDLAIPFLERALTLNPSEQKISNALGVAYFKLGRLDMAKAYYGATLELEPGNKDAKSLFTAMEKLQRRAELATVTETE